MKTAFLKVTNVAQCFPADVAHERFEISPSQQVLKQNPNKVFEYENSFFKSY